MFDGFDDMLLGKFEEYFVNVNKIDANLFCVKIII